MHLASGNRCGHNPDAPKLLIPHPAPEGKGGYPPLLTHAIAAFSDYYWNPALLRLLEDLNEERGKRSERREALVRMVSAILKRFDILTYTVLMPTPGAFKFSSELAAAFGQAKDRLVNATFSFLAEEAGLPMRRAERAIHDLEEVGFLIIAQQRRLVSEPDDSERLYRSDAAIKKVAPELFSLLGLGDELRAERARREKAFRKQQREEDREREAPMPTEKERAEQSLARKRLRNVLQTTLNFPPKTPAPRSPQDQLRWTMATFTLQRQHPDWTSEQVRAAADKEMAN